MNTDVMVGFPQPDGKIRMEFPKQFYAWVKRRFPAGSAVRVTVEDVAVAKTRAQERGFHAMLKPWTSEGHRLDDLKQFLLRDVFGAREAVNPITGEVVEVLAEPHTSTLTKEQYSELIERTLVVAAECGVLLQAPDEYRRQHPEIYATARRRA